MTDISINFGKKINKIKPLHGVNNGPVCYGSLVDVSHYYIEIGIPYIRLHDSNWPHPREVDIYTIFQDFEKDPEDSTSYDFSSTDGYIQSIVATGADIVFRLGVSIEHTKKKCFTSPPKNYEKWAKICVGIIKHYNHGWLNGFNYGIKYWEIWNEPDNPDGDCMWSGTPEQYFELYSTAATMIKEFDFNLKVGGFAATMINLEFVDKFLQYCQKNLLPLDFFSWHTYTSYPDQIIANACLVRSILDKYGFTKTESHLNEWNYMDINPDQWQKIWAQGSEYIRRDVFEKAKNEEGASFDAAVLMLLQDCPVEMANYYDGQPSALLCGLFDYYGVPQKAYYAFKAFKELYNHTYRVSTEISPNIKGFYCCAGMNEIEDETVILISNFSSESREYIIKIDNLPWQGQFICEQYLLDKERNLELEGSAVIPPDNIRIKKYIERHSIVLLKLKLENNLKSIRQ